MYVQGQFRSSVDVRGSVRVRGRSDDGQVVRLSSGQSQVSIKSQKFSELVGVET